ncbi:enoyl-CoA hydratase/isomerase family protein [Futiania mangrovi]|uniref:Enoyl-CoA hydratase/isomerase family protein n=1 Tax=Futiania mangrovi TaxID=2959716 RepID=A0A9J6PAL7_9PROT|nr:enoyl-CoA hydratase/isomerase family protein [Futiania mangrovii]MCP1335473.1 enoyl-CoA hydratase/isomerase family protein [Futiania mangrovii]
MSASEAATETQHATLGIKGHVAVITLNRPEKRNSISLQMLDDIEACLDQAVAAGCRVLVFRGAGGNFCAGADLAYVSGLLAEAPWRFSEEFVPYVQRVMNRIEDLPMPVVAAIEGFCLAGGFELALCCDIVVAARTARIGDGHAIYGFLPGSGGAYRLTRKAGVNRAKYIAFSGDIFTPDQMFDMGLVSRVVDDSAFDTELASLTEKLAARSPIGLKRMKELIHLSDQSDRASGLTAERVASAAHTGTADMAEGLAAFSEKRAPVFTGR